MAMERIRLEIEFDPSDGPIRGRLTDSRGTTTAFWGWLELSALLENVRVNGDQQSSVGP